MSSRFSTCFSIKQSSSEFRGLKQYKSSGKQTNKAHATRANRNKSQVFALSSTAFSVCIALSTYSLPSMINPAFADGPKGGVVVGGSGDISKVDAATTLINQSSHHMAINWDSYNLSANETVRYVQPSASAISLNRILGVNGSTIAGNIESNGQVILINPNGLVFTHTAVLNVGGIIASGLDMSTSDFMNGDYIFNEMTFDGGDSASSGRVINRGLINAATGGNVALIGKQVVNEGLIEANLGSVTLATGKQAVLTFDASGVLGVKVSEAILQEELGVDPALINSGEINAQGGRVLLTASTSQDVFSQAVNSGLEQATSVVVHDDGSFTLGGGADVVNSGRIDVSSHSIDLSTSGAGQIVVLGENITSSGEILANVSANAKSFKAGEIEIHAQDTLLLTEQSLTSARGNENSVGGTIKALADNVGLFDDAIIDAQSYEVTVSSTTGGGFASITTTDVAQVSVSDTIDTTTLSLSDISVTEGSGTATISGSLDHTPQTQFVVTLSNDKTEYIAKVVGNDAGSDLAVIKIEAKKLTHIKIGDSTSLKVGDVVIAIGNPFGIGVTATQGIISALNKNKVGINRYENYIQTDASINPGNSGGALVDSRGALIGINSAILSKSGGNNGIGFAIPVQMVQNVVKKLVMDGKVSRGYLGVSIDDLNKDISKLYNHKNGALVLNVAKDTPAIKYGIKRGDLIYAINGKTVKDRISLQNTIASFKPNQKIKLSIERNKKNISIDIVLGNRTGLGSSLGNKVFKGLDLANITPKISKKFRLPSGAVGVVIKGIKAKSKAEKVGFQLGDVIIQIEDIEITSLQDIQQAVDLNKKQHKRIYINRYGRVLLLVMK